MDVLRAAVLAVIAMVVFLVLMRIFFGKSKKDSSHDSRPLSEEQSSYQRKEFYQQAAPMPIMTNHASERMGERLNVFGEEQVRLMNMAFQYGKTADRTSGDIRSRLEDIQSRSEDETIVKYYSGAVFIFAADDLVLKTVYRLDNTLQNRIYH